MLRRVAPKALRRPISRVRSRHRHQHDVDHSDCAQTERHQTDGSEERIHGIGDFADHLGAGDRVPIVKGVGRLGIKAMVSGNDAAHGFLGLHVLLRV